MLTPNHPLYQKNGPTFFIGYRHPIWTVLYHRFTRRCVLHAFGNASCVTNVWSPYRITPIHWLMARRRLWRNHVVSLYWRTRHLLLRFLCLHEAVTLPFVVAIFWPNLHSTIIHLHFGDCLSGTLFSSRWSAMEYRRCQPLCARFIAREDPHSKCIKCLGFSHARDAVYGISKCKFCENFRLITLRNLPSFPVAPQRPLVKPRPGVRMLRGERRRRWKEREIREGLAHPGAHHQMVLRQLDGLRQRRRVVALDPLGSSAGQLSDELFLHHQIDDSLDVAGLGHEPLAARVPELLGQHKRSAVVP